MAHEVMEERLEVSAEESAEGLGSTFFSSGFLVWISASPARLLTFQGVQ